MGKLSIISNFDLNLDVQVNTYCELYVDMFPTTQKKNIRILWVVEPNELSQIREQIIKNYEEFDLILSWDSKILTECPNSKLFPYGTTWVNNFDFSIQKEFCITTLVGGKNFLPGHEFRHSFLEKLPLIKNIKVDVFNSINFPNNNFESYKIITDKSCKNELFYSQFHIAVENISIDNWFTEKLIDCFQTKTIPIYFGCPNITNFFDKRGFFHIDTMDELLEICGNITNETYESMLDYIHINYELSKNYCDYKKRLKTEIEELILKKHL